MGCVIFGYSFTPKENDYVKDTSYQVPIRNDWEFSWDDFTFVLTYRHLGCHPLRLFLIMVCYFILSLLYVRKETTKILDCFTRIIRNPRTFSSGVFYCLLYITKIKPEHGNV
jgi:hypothetical protein